MFRFRGRAPVPCRNCVEGPAVVETTTATYSGDFIRPSIFSDTTGARTRSGRCRQVQRSFGERR